MDGYERLANEIIILAANDYRRALEGLRKHPYSRAAKKTIKELEDFFHSDWYSNLTEVDGELIIKRIREE